MTKKCKRITFHCDDCGHEWQETTCPSDDDILCPVEGCSEKLSLLKKTKVSDTVEIAHFKCPKGHKRPEKCCCCKIPLPSECDGCLEDCVLDLVIIESDKGDGPPPCPCPCPNGHCSPIPKGICRSKAGCKQIAVCMVCGIMYTCPIESGTVCPHCCSSKHLAHAIVVDATGKPVLIGEDYDVIVYCTQCEKGKEPKPDENIKECGK